MHPDPDPDPAFQLNPDTDPVRIQGFEEKKLKEVQAIEEDFSPQKKTSSTSKNEIYELFSIFVGYFCPPLNPNTIRNCQTVKTKKMSALPFQEMDTNFRKFLPLQTTSRSNKLSLVQPHHPFPPPPPQVLSCVRSWNF